MALKLLLMSQEDVKDGINAIGADYVLKHKEDAVDGSAYHEYLTCGYVIGCDYIVHKKKTYMIKKSFILPEDGDVYILGVESVQGCDIIKPDVYEDPEEALNALNNLQDGDNIVIACDVEVPASIEIPSGVSATIDLSEGNLIPPEPVNNRSIYVIDNHGDLTIAGGKFESRGVSNDGKLTVNGGELIARDTNGGAAIWNEGDLTINEGVFRTLYEGSVQENTGPGCLNNSGTCVINGGEFISPNNRCYAIISSGDITINADITVDGAHGGICINGGKCVINSGHFKSHNFYGLYVSNDAGTDAEVIVNNAVIEGKVTSILVGSDGGGSVGSTVDVRGGKLENKVVNQKNVAAGKGVKLSGGLIKEAVDQSYLADGYVLTDMPDGNGYYHVVRVSE